MQTSVTDDDDASATISDGGAATTETDTDGGSKDDAVESLAKLKSTPFVQGDKVLAYHSQRIYEAKVLEVDPTKERFFVHYQGWNKNWDEWVGMDRLMRHNKENLEKQKALEKEYPLEKSVRAFHLKPKNPNVTRGKKRKRFIKGTASYEKLVDVQIPSPLKKHLVNYCEYVTHMGKLVELPCCPNVDEILKLYMEHQSNKDGRASVEIISGLRCYFDKALPVMLLYKGERKQYEEATANGIPPSKVYGAEHLLRLFGGKRTFQTIPTRLIAILDRLQSNCQRYCTMLTSKRRPWQTCNTSYKTFSSSYRKNRACSLYQPMKHQMFLAQ